MSIYRFIPKDRPWENFVVDTEDAKAVHGWTMVDGKWHFMDAVRDPSEDFGEFGFRVLRLDGQ